MTLVAALNRNGLLIASGLRMLPVQYVSDEEFANSVATAISQTPYLLYEPPAQPAVCAVCPGTLWMSLTAETCYRNTVANAIGCAVASRLELDNDWADNVRIALHEAVSNAVIHGNLGVDGISLNSGNFSDYYEWIETKLSLPLLATSAVHIGCTLGEGKVALDVIDAGKGYAYRDFLYDSATRARYKGLSLIFSLSSYVHILGEGTHIRMEFNYNT